ncbi:MAG: DoxX family protein [Cyclobacteriaceae bacterium]
MKTALKVNWILITLLSIATGAFKLAQQPEDIELFAAIGMNATATTILGLVQLIGGVLLIPARTRTKGAWVMLLTFILASIAVFANQMLIFGIVSLLFIVMAYGVIHMQNQLTKN